LTFAVNEQPHQMTSTGATWDQVGDTWTRRTRSSASAERLGTSIVSS